MRKRMNDFVESIGRFWDSLSTPVQAALFTGLLSVLRLAYDSKDGRRLYRKVLETGICICVTFGAAKGFGAIGVNSDAAWLVAIALGWAGADYVREKGRVWADKKVENNDSKTPGNS